MDSGNTHCGLFRGRRELLFIFQIIGHKFGKRNGPTRNIRGEYRGKKWAYFFKKWLSRAVVKDDLVKLFEIQHGGSEKGPNFGVPPGSFWFTLEADLPLEILDDIVQTKSSMKKVGKMVKELEMDMVRVGF
jgi:hypothetical protein